MTLFGRDFLTGFCGSLTSSSDDDELVESSDESSSDDIFGLFGLSGARLLIGERDRERLRMGDGVREPYLRYVSGEMLLPRFRLARKLPLCEISILTRFRPQIRFR